VSRILTPTGVGLGMLSKLICLLLFLPAALTIP
jgi:hypothetical protein